MGNHNQTCTDLEFIQLWSELQSAAKVANHLNIATRAVYLRRRWIEGHYKITLGAADHRGSLYELNRPKSFSPLKSENGVTLRLCKCPVTIDTPAFTVLL